MSKKLEEMLKELQSIEAKAILPPKFSPTKATNMFGRTDELKATLAKIRELEATHPSAEKFISPSIPVGSLCNKGDLIRAKNHLQHLKAAKPVAAVRKPIAAPKITATNGKQIVTRAQFRAMTPERKMQVATNPQIKIID